jgi:ubiquinone/menaquinone biosynthesis C-methylase UbiE
MNQKQKDIFLLTEGDAWFDRNYKNLKNKKYNFEDSIIQSVHKCLNSSFLLEKRKSREEIKLLEIGCGDARRLKWMSKNLDIQCQGIDPSAKAVEFARSNGINCIQATADSLPFNNQDFDIVIFGFCLYLCDRGDLFKIAYESNRVLKSNSWLIINDFFSEIPIANNYHHYPNVFSYKMDYRKIFNWHPDYACYEHKILKNKNTGYIDDPAEWIAISIIRKNTLNE